MLKKTGGKHSPFYMSISPQKTGGVPTTSPDEVPIGKGGYGDIFRVRGQKPGQKILRKQFRNIDDNKQRRLVEIVQFLERIDPSQQFFTGRLKKNPRLSTKKNIFFMRQSGKSLRNMVQELAGDDKREERCRFIFRMLENFPNLMIGVNNLIQSNIIHGDIKMDNILFDKTENKLRLIDYDFLGTKDEYQDSSRRGVIFPNVSKDHFYPFWPLERFGLVSWGVLDKAKLLKLLQQLHSTSIFKEKLLKDIYEILEQTPPVQIQENPLKIDIYSLGVVAYELFITSKFYKCLGKDSAESNKIKEALESIIVRNMLHPIPEMRNLPYNQWIQFSQQLRLLHQKRQQETKRLERQKQEFIKNLLRPLACPRK